MLVGFLCTPFSPTGEWNGKFRLLFVGNANYSTVKLHNYNIHKHGQVKLEKQVLKHFSLMYAY